jgi:hypothetical protein
MSNTLSVSYDKNYGVQAIWTLSKRYTQNSSKTRIVDPESKPKLMSYPVSIGIFKGIG